jgi:hypothetical protein
MPAAMAQNCRVEGFDGRCFRLGDPSRLDNNGNLSPRIVFSSEAWASQTLGMETMITRLGRETMITSLIGTQVHKSSVVNLKDG